jgi:hypothetical protein
LVVEVGVLFNIWASRERGSEGARREKGGGRRGWAEERGAKGRGGEGYNERRQSEDVGQYIASHHRDREG